MILFLTPPFVQLNTPYPATPSLVGFLSSYGIECTQRDLSIEVALETLRRYGDDFTDEAIEILQNPHLSDEAKVETTEYIDELALWIRDHVDEDFGFSRYAERLGVAVTDFSIILKRLRRRSAVDRILEEQTEAALRDAGMLDLPRKGETHFVGVTCPFPGTLLGAFRIARTIRRIAPHVITVLGGGYVNTELRELNDSRVGRFFDHVMYDEGYLPWLELLSEVESAELRVQSGGRGPVAAESIPKFVKPSYHGLCLPQYMDLPESENPMHRLWSTGRWLKIQMARGCYWHQCAFCDVTLDYIKCFSMPTATEVVDAMQALARETGEASFHFTDEAMPPALIEKMCRELVRRKFKCRWWGNIRFDASFTPALARLMARAGCIAVSGGLECAVDRLLLLMRKGITLASARQALQAFRDAGIMVHAYLMYGFPTEMEREARSALGYVRRCFREGLVQSAYFHRFALTVHSPIAREPARFGIEIAPEHLSAPKRGRVFARNEIPYVERNAPDWDRIGRALRLALYNYMQGRGYSKPISFWFDNA